MGLPGPASPNKSQRQWLRMLPCKLHASLAFQNVEADHVYQTDTRLIQRFLSCFRSLVSDMTIYDQGGAKKNTRPDPRNPIQLSFLSVTSCFFNFAHF